MSPQQTRISAKKSSSIPIGPKYTPAPVLQPKATKKPDRQLPEWQPEGGGMVSPLQRLLDTNAVQAKLTIGEPNDKYEQEADAVAQDVVQRLHSPVSETPPETAVQRETEAGKDKLQRKPILQKTHAVGGEPASPDLEGSINRAKGGGQPLDAGLQRSMSQAMGADFSGVRVHTDSHADQLNQSIQAKAFTTGQDVFFRQGAYDPGSRGGQELIAHELTHVVQQKGTLSRTIQRNSWIKRQKRIIARVLFKKLPANTYRFDTRTPEQIAQTGFQPWKNTGNITIREHVENAYQQRPNQGKQTKYDSQFVSTGGYGILKKIDPTFAQGLLNTNVYKIDTAIAAQTGRFHDVNDHFDKIGVKRPYATQREWLKEGGIPPAAVVEWMPGIDFADQLNSQGQAPDESSLTGWRNMPPPVGND
jgi:hypothetical protein